MYEYIHWWFVKWLGETDIVVQKKVKPTFLHYDRLLAQRNKYFTCGNTDESVMWPILCKIGQCGDMADYTFDYW